jgi:hypothetical protein
VVVTPWLASAVMVMGSVVDGPGLQSPSPSFEQAAQAVSAPVLPPGRIAADRTFPTTGGTADGLPRTLHATSAGQVHQVAAAWIARQDAPLVALPSIGLPTIAAVDDPPLPKGPLTQLAALLILTLVLTRRSAYPQVPGLPTLPPHTPASPSLLRGPR